LESIGAGVEVQNISNPQSSSSSSSSSSIVGSKRGRSSSSSSSSSRGSKRQKNEKNEMINHPGQWLFEEGFAYLHGSNFKMMDKKRSQLMIEASASAGFPMAVAYCYYEGWNGLKKDDKKAFDEFVKIENDTNGYHYAQFMIGRCYHYGQGTVKDMVRAAESYTKSAEQGISNAMCTLGYFYSNGLGVTKDLTKTFELYKQSALLGHSMGMFNLGVYYQYGVGVAKDVNKAKEWYAKAAAHGNTKAQTELNRLKAR